MVHLLGTLWNRSRLMEATVRSTNGFQRFFNLFSYLSSSGSLYNQWHSFEFLYCECPLPHVLYSWFCRKGLFEIFEFRPAFKLAVALFSCGVFDKLPEVSSPRVDEPPAGSFEFCRVARCLLWRVTSKIVQSSSFYIFKDLPVCDCFQNVSRRDGGSSVVNWVGWKLGIGNNGAPRGLLQVFEVSRADLQLPLLGTHSFLIRFSSRLNKIVCSLNYV